MTRLVTAPDGAGDAPDRQFFEGKKPERVFEPPRMKPQGTATTPPGTAREQSRRSTAERLGRIYEPVRGELCALREAFGQSVGRPADLWSGSVFPRPSVSPPLPGEDAVCVPLVDEMSSQLRKMEGKWIRAGVVLLARKAFGGTTEETIRVAGALELIHLATLVHDDIIDEAETRRGLPSLPRIHGQAASVLMGDLLYARAMKLLIQTDHTALLRNVIETVEEVCLGEIAEHQFSLDCPPTENDYLTVIRRKTASLLGCCARAGCLLASQDGEWADRFAEFGLNLGMAFQITDDVLDLVGDGPSLGKDPGADLRNGNITLPIIHLLGVRPETSLRRLLATVGANSHLARVLKESGSLEYAHDAAEAYAAKARDALTPIEREIPGSEELQSLKDLASLVVDRRY